MAHLSTGLGDGMLQLSTLWSLACGEAREEYANGAVALAFPRNLRSADNG